MSTLAYITNLVREIVGLNAKSASKLSPSGSFYDLRAISIDGKEIEMSSYRGKVLLIVNSASQCGFTSQYEGLEIIYQKYKDRGFEVLGFPSNDFAGQEPGGDQEIQKFCQVKYGVTFPLFQKNSVSGKEKQTVFKFLTESGNTKLNGEVLWNFEKFLIDRNGKLVERFRSTTGPRNDRVMKAIEVLLEEGNAPSNKQH